MINKILFKNYKSFKNEQCLEIKPLTIIIGKNSSGKSAVVKLPTLIEGSLSGDFQDPVMVTNGGVELGAEFRDLIYGRQVGSLSLSLEESGSELDVEIASGYGKSDLPKIRTWKYNKEIDLRLNDKEGTYQYKGENMEIKFNGFKIDDNSNKKYELTIQNFNLNTNYIGPFRDVPQRTYNSIGNPRTKKIGIKGEHTYQLLISDYLYNDSKLLTKVSNWYIENFDGWGLQINSRSQPDYKIELFRENPDFNINIRDVGEGMSQVLPLVVSAFIKHDKNILTIIEQPELHLHPAAHGNLAELFANETLNTNKYFLIETHSKNFVLRVRRLIAEGRMNKNNVALYFVDYDPDTNSSKLIDIKIYDGGEVSYWPENVFSESLNEIIAIRTAQQNK